MPLCTNCAHPVPHLYTVYQSAHNVRLSQCPACHELADPYVEHDGLNVVLDLILLKRAVYRHLLFNRGSPPRRVDEGQTKKDGSASGRNDNTRDADATREWARWWLVLRVGLGVVLADACTCSLPCAAVHLLTSPAVIRWSQLQPSATSDAPKQSAWTPEATETFFRVLLGCLVETFAFHAGITLSSFLVLTGLNYAARRYRPSSDSPISGVRQQLRYSHISLCLLYSSLTKFFLLLLLSIWGQPQPAPSPRPTYKHTIAIESPLLKMMWEALDDDKLDREWVVRNVLGGMATGFGLRVVLDCHPFFTTVIIMAGWAVKTAVANAVGRWVGQEAAVGDTWLAYSIP
ncbi:Arv1-domain-containing protein [Auriscalpium vulgare]|uniref:Arv1-domain-containing protein n=1 Tax=Auriscalpium vulgare TaxID=40419 RepID=A0ACB8SA95_9AGAM|nr:Arv1-domain-containing protein [Auriscalpium vulgare]